MKDRKKLESIDIDGVYLSDVSPKDKTWDKHRANSDTVRDLYSELGYERYPERINDCSKLLEFVRKQDFQNESLLKLLSARFCRIRLCPVCQWRRTSMWRARFCKAIPGIRTDYPNHQFILLTLTVRNCDVENLRETLNWMNKSWYKLIRRKVFPAIGWVKSTEITKSQDSKVHPHFHCILIVPNSYFQGGLYLSKNKWTELWKKSLKIDYQPIVDVRKLYLSKKVEKKLVDLLGRDLTSDERVFYSLMEGLKYSVKEGDLVSDPQWLDAITKQLHKTRAIALGGIFKKYLSEDEPENLIHADIEDDIEIVETDARFLFGWKEKKKRYQSL